MGFAQVLVTAAGGRHGVEAMLAFSAIARGVQAPPGGKSLARLFSTADGLATAIRILLPIMQVNQLASAVHSGIQEVAVTPLSAWCCCHAARLILHWCGGG